MMLSNRISTFLRLAAQEQQWQQQRGMATLKAISIRLKSVKNIQKITQSMKMVSAAKYNRAERDLKQARPLGTGTKVFYEQAEIQSPPEEPKKLVIAVTSDRGLCGAVHSGISRKIRDQLLDEPKDRRGDTKIICIGEKSRAILQRHFPKNILFVASEVGRKPPTFNDAAKIAIQILNSGYSFGSGRILYNRFKSVVSYAIDELPLFDKNAVIIAPKLSVYDSLDDEVIQSYLEFSLASLLFYSMKESACSEQSSRMTAMDNASKNAGEMIDKLTLTFNRTRQAVITRELIEIISGAAALD
ncbi:PREDICTED: ATP synthase subunit gamma, mitochondrial [Trachymyrmex septentrionalis]|nr:PREDICTED: ATP synthase subunit gamma, mitochondrial [Trachymyrmex septentrionalis]XP_018350415.1 PREDICTED: ATP synthase subunit gamma, mitochondrial [Trachymyrmex septentrionalis]